MVGQNQVRRGTIDVVATVGPPVSALRHVRPSGPNDPINREVACVKYGAGNAWVFCPAADRRKPGVSYACGRYEATAGGVVVGRGGVRPTGNLRAGVKRAKTVAMCVARVECRYAVAYRSMSCRRPNSHPSVPPSRLSFLQCKPNREAFCFSAYVAP